jgi:hypothetical protein
VKLLKQEDAVLGPDDCGSLYEETSDKEALNKIKETLRFQIESHDGPHSQSGGLNAQKPMRLFSQTTAQKPMRPFSQTAADSARSPSTALQSPEGVTGSNGDAFSMPKVIKDPLAELISNDKVPHLLQGGTEPTAMGVSNLGGVSSLHDASQGIQNLTSPILANCFPYAVSFNSNASSFTNGERRPVSGSCCSLQHTFPLVPSYLVNGNANGTFPILSDRLCMAGRRTKELAYLEMILADDASRQEMETRIRQEELALLLEMITTNRLSAILRQIQYPQD